MYGGRPLVRHLEIQLVDVNTIMTHNFTTKIVDHDDPNTMPCPVDEQAELRGEDATIMTLKSGCPQSPEAMDSLAVAILHSSTVHRAWHHQNLPVIP